MGTFPEDPWAGKRVVTPRGPRIVKTSADDPAAQPGGGMTLDALMLRQKELAGNKAAMPATMGTPMEGVFYALQKGLEGYQQGRAERDVSTGQQAVGNAFATMGPNGELTPEGKAAMARYSPDTFLELWKVAQAKSQRQEQFGEIVTGDAAAKLGLDPTKQYQQNLKTMQWEPIGGGGTVIDVGQKTESTYEQGQANAFIKQTTAADNEGMQAQGRMADIGQLELLLKDGVPTGTKANLLTYLKDNWGVSLGPDTDKVSAFNSLIDRIAPTMRPVGSGPMSDSDVRMFKNGLPSLTASQEGNALIIAGMKGVAEYNIAVGQLARQVATMPYKEARAAWDKGLADLAKNLDPLKHVREYLSRRKDGSGTGDGSGGGGGGDPDPDLS